MTRFDAAIIGAGPAGLAAARTLAAAGMSCVVAAPTGGPGGPWGRLELSGAVFDRTPEIKRSPAAETAAEPISLLYNGTPLTVSPQGVADALCRIAPDRAAAAGEWLACCRDTAAALELLKKKPRMGGLGLLMNQHSRYMRTAPLTVEQVLDDLHLKTDAVAALMEAVGTVLGRTPALQASFPAFAVSLCDAENEVLSFDSTADTCAALLSDCLRAGVTLRLGERLLAPTWQGDTLKAISTEKGQPIAADIYLFDSCLELLTMEDTPAAVRTALSLREQTPPQASLYLGFSVPLAEMGLTHGVSLVSPIPAPFTGVCRIFCTDTPKGATVTVAAALNPDTLADLDEEHYLAWKESASQTLWEHTAQALPMRGLPKPFARYFAGPAEFALWGGAANGGVGWQLRSEFCGQPTLLTQEPLPIPLPGVWLCSGATLAQCLARVQAMAARIARKGE